MVNSGLRPCAAPVPKRAVQDRRRLKACFFPDARINQANRSSLWGSEVVLAQPIHGLLKVTAAILAVEH
jgi:hypothetical protein